MRQKFTGALTLIVGRVLIQMIPPSNVQGVLDSMGYHKHFSLEEMRIKERKLVLCAPSVLVSVDRAYLWDKGSSWTTSFSVPRISIYSNQNCRARLNQRLAQIDTGSEQQNTIRSHR